jgi:hypothetical protein
MSVDNLQYTKDMLQGNISRMILTNDMAELEIMYAHAKRNIYLLYEFKKNKLNERSDSNE